MQKASSRFPIERFPGRVASGIVEAGFRSRLYLRYIVNACQRGCESVNRPTEAIVFIPEGIVVGGRGKAERTVEFPWWWRARVDRERVEELRRGSGRREARNAKRAQDCTRAIEF